MDRMCVQCGAIRNYRTKMLCAKCSKLNTRKVKRPDLEILQKQIEELGFSATGRLYGVSDNAIRKWLKAYLPKL